MGYLIGIVGPTGAGKTTLATGLGKVYGFTVHQEKPQENPYWDQFYQELNEGGISSTALKSQLFFLLTAQQQASSLNATGDTIIWDVPIFGHKMYADLLYQQGRMSKADYDVYMQVYQLCLSAIPKPHLLVVATANLATLVDRIHERGRAAELSTPTDYWQQHIGYWDTQLSQQAGSIPLLKVDSGDINWKKKTGVKKVWADIEKIMYAAAVN